MKYHKKPSWAIKVAETIKFRTTVNNVAANRMDFAIRDEIVLALLEAEQRGYDRAKSENTSCN